MDYADIKEKRVQLIHGDCLEKMKDVPDKSIDMILTDPPYLKAYSTSHRNGVARKTTEIQHAKFLAQIIGG